MALAHVPMSDGPHHARATFIAKPADLAVVNAFDPITRYA
jgi:hypothetical protein